MKHFDEIKGNLGFGSLRLPTKGDNSVDIELMKRMVDYFLQNDFNYFDSAHAYMNGRCEESIRLCVASRYPRERYVLTDKLTYAFFNKKEDVRPFFENQLKSCGVDYFDFYLMHAMTRKRYEKFRRCEAFETAVKLKDEGKIKHFGISFHDKADFLEELLVQYPEIEVVQIQFNYVDYDSPAIESRKVYEVCKKYGKPVFVMEPVKGGSLQRLPPDAKVIFDELNKKNKTSYSYASYAIRYAASFDQIEVVLSGMNSMDQLVDNVRFMREFHPLNKEEMTQVEKVRNVFNSQQLIQCTGCRYCTDECPRHILIPDLFSCLNQKKVFNNFNQAYYYNNVLTINNGKASECLKCGRCEASCPQKLPIRRLLEDVANEFEIRITDLDKGNPQYRYAEWAVNKKITFLNKEKRVFPSRIARRIDLAVFMWRFAGRPSCQEDKYEIRDIGSDFGFKDAVYWVLSKKIMFTDKLNNFNAEKQCSRLDFIVYLWRWAGRPSAGKIIEISDYSDGPFIEAVKWAIEKEIVQLDRDKLVRPYDKISRITAFEFLFHYRVLNL